MACSSHPRPAGHATTDRPTRRLLVSAPAHGCRRPPYTAVCYSAAHSLKPFLKERGEKRERGKRSGAETRERAVKKSYLPEYTAHLPHGHCFCLRSSVSAAHIGRTGTAAAGDHVNSGFYGRLKNQRHFSPSFLLSIAPGTVYISSIRPIARSSLRTFIYTPPQFQIIALGFRFGDTPLFNVVFYRKLLFPRNHLTRGCSKEITLDNVSRPKTDL